ncbi:MAG: hypothetical protein KGH55_01685 [Nanoarchaeota archaeon]|nr:hypothetical protein [Nanoarchaeota archaeon]
MKKDNKIIKGIKRAAQAGMLAFTLNYAMPIVIVNDISAIRRGDLPESYLEDINHSPVHDKNRSWGAERYLNLANIVVDDIEKQKDWVCQDYAGAVYETYLDIIRANNRKDLEKKIRLAYNYDFENSSQGHVWIEINENGKWIPKGVTPWELNSYGVPQSRNPKDYKPEFVSIPGKRITYPVSFHSLIKTGGAVKIFYNLAGNIAKASSENNQN